MDNILKDAEISSRNRNRRNKKRRATFEPNEGMDFDDLVKKLEEIPTFKGRWEFMSKYEVTHSNNRVIEYIYALRLLSEATMAHFDETRDESEQQAISDLTPLIIDILDQLWFFGVKDEPDDNLYELIWVTVLGVRGVRSYWKLNKMGHLISMAYERQLVLIKKPYNEWFLSDLVLTVEHLAREWPVTIIDGVTESVVNSMRLVYEKLQNYVYGTDLAVLDYPGFSELVHTDWGPALAITKEFDRDINAYFHDMQVTIEIREQMLKRFHQITEIDDISEAAKTAVAGWMNLRSHSQEGDAGGTVLKKFRAWYFWFYKRPGSTERYNARAVEKIGQQASFQRDVSLDAKLAQAELEFGTLHLEESQAFTNAYFACDTDYVVAMRNSAGFGVQAYNLLVLLAFAYTIDFHLETQFLNDYYINAPEKDMFIHREATKRILLVRVNAEFYVVETDTLFAVVTDNIETALYHWLKAYKKIILEPTDLKKAEAFENQVFVLGTYEMRSLYKEDDAYVGRMVQNKNILSRISRSIKK